MTTKVRWSFRRRWVGFTLIEVVLAIAIVSFTLVSLIGLLAGGLQSGRESVEDVQASDIAGQVLAQRRAAPLLEDAELILPRLNDDLLCPVLGPGVVPRRGVVYLTRDGRLAENEGERHYRLDYACGREAGGRLARVHVSINTPWRAVPPEVTPPAANSAKVATRFEALAYIALGGAP